MILPRSSKTARGPTRGPALSTTQITRNRRSAALSQRVDAALGDGAGDDALLDLLGTLEDVPALGFAAHALDVRPTGVAVAPVVLDGRPGAPGRAGGRVVSVQRV